MIYSCCYGMRDKARPLLLALAAVAAAMPAASAAAQSDEQRLLVDEIRAGTEPSDLVVRVVILNSGSRPAVTELPARIPAELVVDGRHLPSTLECDRPQEDSAIGPGRFGSADCLLHLPADIVAGEEAFLAIGGRSPSPKYVFSVPAAQLASGDQQTEGSAESGVTLAPSAMPSAKPDDGNAYLGNLSAYAPIYAVYGPGTNSEGRIQVSFKYQLFGKAGDIGGGAPFINGLHFAYTQRMLWDLGAESSPFRNIDYMPEIFYLQPAIEIGDGFTLGGQIGFRHESNGRDGDASRSANTVYVQPITTMKAGDYTIAIGPRLFFYVGDLDDNPDIRRYRGATGLFAEIGQDNGLRLTTNSRFNFSSGKGAIDAELSYPLDRIVDTDLNLYLFGQGFAGYGENLLDYNRKTTRLRFGIAIVR